MLGALILKSRLGCGWTKVVRNGTAMLGAVVLFALGSMNGVSTNDIHSAGRLLPGGAAAVQCLGASSLPKNGKAGVRVHFSAKSILTPIFPHSIGRNSCDRHPPSCG